MQQLLPLLLLLLGILPVPLPLLDGGSLGPSEFDLLHLLALESLAVDAGLDLVVRVDEVRLVHGGRHVLDQLQRQTLRGAAVVLRIGVHAVHQLKHRGKHRTRRVVVGRAVALLEQLEGHLEKQKDVLQLGLGVIHVQHHLPSEEGAPAEQLAEVEAASEGVVSGNGQLE